LDTDGNPIFIGHHKKINKNFKGLFSTKKPNYNQNFVEEDEDMIRKFLNKGLPMEEKKVIIKPMKSKLPVAGVSMNK
jgi:hypothetical protein